MTRSQQATIDSTTTDVLSRSDDGQRSTGAGQSGANPQGKGSVPVLDALRAVRPQAGDTKRPQDILRDLCLSTLVLSSTFGFRVVPGKDYYLYRVGEEWSLSLLSPEDWGSRQPGSFVASGVLGSDMTWKLEFAPDVAANPDVLSVLENHVREFVERITSVGTLEQALPTYAAELPYRQRVLASALASSLRQAAAVAGLSGSAPRAWLPGDSIRAVLAAPMAGRN